MTTTELKPPIFLIGNYRSGTTIAQKLIGLHPDIVTWYEPRTLWLYADPARRHDEFGQTDATEKVTRYIRDRFLEYQSRNGGRQIMENTPSNVLRVPFVHEIFPEAIFLYITRNPFSCVSSMELKWQRTKTFKGIRRTLSTTPVTQIHYYAKDFIKQIIANKILKRKYTPIYGPRYKGIDRDLQEHEKLTVIARQWARGNQKAREDLARLGSGRVFSFRYEDLMQDPEPVLRRIYQHCGLDCTDDIVRTAKEMIDPGRQQKWLRFEPKDLTAIIPEIRDEMAFYHYEIPQPLR
ncbi:sulfotransferase [Mesorhizobium sp.]|uniref:sulfotransferase family protein n=1 Tax=Mesorhizobium sp. TaxID=1871066 RepID=UPI000FE32ADF|nr:sulfotransferase [Mesorhizobium sp.]RWA77248.1 MAG: sulfotransferase [Mesorhizobium sp.]RWC01122.1 MAG: sulfotransferase [Mesorhizobium sp.]RWG84880.1 MAG: sulfotransferase [Mesorhizobium sp.]RWG90130.1 MAG: sulfotransferase [Mesorhizobium sp.]RWK05065.1 MAG: sulfotransferase [Mesorhizobium sp.]